MQHSVNRGAARHGVSNSAENDIPSRSFAAAGAWPEMNRSISSSHSRKMHRHRVQPSKVLPVRCKIFRSSFVDWPSVNRRCFFFFVCLATWRFASRTLLRQSSHASHIFAGHSRSFFFVRTAAVRGVPHFTVPNILSFAPFIPGGACKIILHESGYLRILET